MDLKEESEKLTDFLSGKTVVELMRHRESEVVMIFSDGTKLFVDCKSSSLEFSVTGGPVDP